MKKRLIFLCMIGLSITGWASSHTFQVSSPDRSYTFTFTEENPEGKTRMYYTLLYKGTEIVHRSELGVEIKNKLLENALAIKNDSCTNWRDNLTFIGTEATSHDGSWSPLYGERTHIPDRYNTLLIKYRKGEVPDAEATDGYDRSRTYFMNIEVRAYNEGVAFRYHFPATGNGLFLHITDELTEFAMPEGTMAYHEAWAQAPINLLPLKNWTDESERPLTMRLPGKLTVSIGEARMVDYVRTKFQLSGNRSHTLRTSMYSCADVITPYASPWRVFMAAERPVDLIAHNFIYQNLNDPNILQGDLSWIKPGKAFRSRLSQKEALEAVDFAAERGLQYIHLDAGWYGAEMKMESDATTVAEEKDLNIKAICDYAATKNIGIWVYVNQRALVQQLDRLLPLYKSWGIKGIKFGFVQVGNQFWTIWLHKAVRQCADYGIMVDIHDEYRPTGVSRTLPHLMTQEGIAGNETMPDARHNTILPFTRFLCGPADYTPCYFNPRIKNTHAHQLAMPVIYYSPITFLYWYDTPSLYHGEKELDFWKHLPATWDETYPIDGEPGEYIAIARRSNENWFVGVMNGLTARRLTVSTAFLQPKRKYSLTLYYDDSNLKTRTQVAIMQKTIKGGEDIRLNLLASGGTAMEIVPLP